MTSGIDATQRLRLQVALAQLGFASRRRAAELIKRGKVKVNGQPILMPGARIDLAKDRITVNGQSSIAQQKVYYLLNKPKGVISTVKDRHAASTVLDIIGPKAVRVYPVGRLDKDTTGLLILSNDGTLAYRLTHPKFGIKKVYRVCVKSSFSGETITKLERGIILEGKKTFPCKIKITATDKEISRLEIQLSEGRKRQIKEMFASLGHPVLAIQRIAFGPLKLAGLEEGNWRALKAQEIVALKKAVRLA